MDGIENLVGKVIFGGWMRRRKGENRRKMKLREMEMGKLGQNRIQGLKKEGRNRALEIGKRNRGKD